MKLQDLLFKLQLMTKHFCPSQLWPIHSRQFTLSLACKIE